MLGCSASPSKLTSRRCGAFTSSPTSFFFTGPTRMDTRDYQMRQASPLVPRPEDKSCSSMLKLKSSVSEMTRGSNDDTQVPWKEMLVAAVQKHEVNKIIKLDQLAIGSTVTLSCRKHDLL
jgi:hypothetical protein